MAAPSLPRPLRALPGRARAAAPPLTGALRGLRGRLRVSVPSPPPLPMTLLVLGAYALALAQRPGEVLADTRLGLALAPQRFLAEAAGVWSSTGDLGHVVAGQDYGYVFPMAPWFAAGDGLGLPVWLVQRLWIGTLLALAALGVVALVRALLDDRRAPTAVAGAVLYVVSPYVVVLVDRASVALLAYAALPWLLLAVHRALPDRRALRDPRALRWPAVFAFVLAACGGGANTGTVGWVLVAPLLLVAYELSCGRVRVRAVARWLTRVLPLAGLLSAWWLVPLAVQARHGLDLRPLTEQPETIWSAASVTESLRGMGRWTSYLGVGFGGTLAPYTTHAGVLLFDLKVVIAGLLVPALVLGALRWTRHVHYAPFFVLLVLVGLVLMGVGFPDGTPLRRAATWAYDDVPVLRALLLEPYGAGPLVTLALAVLGGVAFSRAWSASSRVPFRLALSAAAAVLVVLAAWPLARGTAPDGGRQVDLPARWTQLAGVLDARGDRDRALVLPGEVTAAYRWGQTGEPVLPLLTAHPVAVRSGVPQAGLRSTDVLTAVDALVSEERLVPGQLPPLLDLLGVGDVVVAADADRARSGALGPLETQDALAAQGLPRGRALGGTRTVRPASGRIGAPASVPLLQDVRVDTGGLVRVVPRSAPTVFDGGARALTALAAFGALNPDRAYAAAADLDGRRIRAVARAGGTVVVADGNRRQARVPARPRGGSGPVLPITQAVGGAAAQDPYADTAAADDAQTVQLLDGVRDVSAPTRASGTQFPEHRPAAALDGELRTAWLADRSLPADQAVLTVTLEAPRDVPTLRLYPYGDARGVVTAVRVNGRRFGVRPGWNTLPVALRGVSEVRVAIDAVRGPRRASAGRGGIREFVLPGVEVREALRPPVVAEQALRGGDLTTATLTYLLERLTAPAPFRQGRYERPAQAGLLSDARDPERQLARVVHPPVVRQFAVSAWARADPSTSDATLDGLSGTTGNLTATSSSRLDGLPRYRASGAFDGRLSRAWVGQWIRGVPAWLKWRTVEPLRVRRFRVLAPKNVRVRRPTRVRLSVDGRRGRVLDVPADGLVTLPEAVRGRAFRLDVVDARWPAGTPRAIRARRAVGIGELRVTGLEALDVPRRGSVGLACGSAAVVARGWGADSQVGRTKLGFRGTVDRARLDAGRPLRLTACGELELPPVDIELHGARAALVLDQLRLDAAPPIGSPVATERTTRRVVSAGRADGSTRTGVSVRTSGPAWLVYGQSYEDGWEATCDGRDLGKPVPLQGYANAWPIVAPGCRDVSFRYGPQDTVRPALLASGIGAAGLLVLLLMGLLVERRATGAPEGSADPSRRTRAGARAAGGATPAVAAYREAVRRLPRMAGGQTRRTGLYAGRTTGDAPAPGAPPAAGAHRWRVGARMPGRAPWLRVRGGWVPRALGRLLRPAAALGRIVSRPLRACGRGTSSAVRAVAGPSGLALRRLALLVAPAGRGIRWWQAGLWGVLSGGAVAVLFGVGPGLVLGPVVALMVWQGVPDAWLATAAGVVLGVVVPVLYVVRDRQDDGPAGFDPAYASDRLWAHRAAVGALVLLAVVLVRTLRSPATADVEPTGPSDAASTGPSDAAARADAASTVWFDAEPEPVGWFEGEEAWPARDPHAERGAPGDAAEGRPHRAEPDAGGPPREPSEAPLAWTARARELRAAVRRWRRKT